MANDFSRKNYKAKKDDGSYIFADFSHGLYLLDTPRGLGEQLATLALKGGRNTFCERGALVPQYGQMSKGAVSSDEQIIAVTKDSKSNASFFIVTASGNIYLYTAAQGLKKYKTSLGDITTDVLCTRHDDNLIIKADGITYIFGGHYDESDTETVNNNIRALDYGDYAVLNIPEASKDYYWIGKEIHLKGIGKFIITRMTSTIGNVLTPISMSQLDGVAYTLKGSVTLDGTNNVYPLINEAGASGTNITTSFETITSGTSTTTVSVEYECYKYSISTGSLTKAQYNSTTKLAVPQNSAGNILSGYFYVKSSSKKTGDKLYFTSNAHTTTSSSNLSTAHYANNNSKYPSKIKKISNGQVSRVAIPLYNTISKLYYDALGNSVVSISRYKAGDITKTTTTTTQTTTSGNVLTFNLPLSNASNFSVTTKTSVGGGTQYLANGTYDYELNYDGIGTFTVSLTSGGNPVTLSASTGSGNLSIVESYPNAELALEAVELLDEDGEPINEESGNIIQARITSSDKNRPALPTGVAVQEKTKKEISLIYNADETSEEQTELSPLLMEVCANRLLVVNSDGNIYYSAVGIVDNFTESAGAGYFGGFYNDSSETLALDDFLNGVLIVKRNGLYYLTINTQINSISVSANSTIGVNISKIAEIGQEYPQDHIVVREKVYAYDTNSNAIVLASSQNAFGNLVAGKTIVASDYLNAKDLGIADVKRNLTYNSEADCFILYYGEHLNHGLVLTNQGSLFPRELKDGFDYYVKFNQGVIAISETGEILQDFRRGTIITNITPIADFEAISLKDNRFCMSSILEVTELNGIEYNITVSNAGTSYQHIHPYINYGVDAVELPPLIYSDVSKGIDSSSFGVTPEEAQAIIDGEMTWTELRARKQLTKWAEKKSNLTRVYAPMSGRNGISISIEFAANQAFCLAALRLPDFSRGE